MTRLQGLNPGSRRKNLPPLEAASIPPAPPRPRPPTAVATAEGPRSLRLTLPLPPRELSPNTRYTTDARGQRVALHWSRKAPIVRDYRMACGALARAAAGRGWAPLERASIALVFTYCGRSRIDADNALASAKAAIDGLADAGIITGDSAKRLRIVGLEVRQERHDRHRGRSCPAGVAVTVTET